MKIKRIVTALTLSICFFPALASAQSFWLHKQVFGNSGGPGGYGRVAAFDSADCIFVAGTPGCAVTRDYLQSWKFGFVDTAKRYNIDFEYSISSIVHPARDIIILGAIAPKLKGKPPFSPGGHILRSTNNGVTWTDTSLGSFDSTKPRNDVIAIAAFDSNRIAVLTASGRLFNSSDGGVSWQAIPCQIFPYSPIQPLTPAIAYPAPNTLVVAALSRQPNGTVIYRTTDRGATWDSVFQLNHNITKFAFVNSFVGFASGTYWASNMTPDTALIDKTTDGGATWKNVYAKQIVVSPNSYYKAKGGINGIAFADSLHGLACGDWGLILRTIDGGAKWEQLTSDYTDDVEGNDLLGDVAYPDTNHAMIASASGEALIYQPNGILSLPNITYPLFSPPSAPKTFDITWDAVPGASRYTIIISTSNYPNPGDTILVRDSNVMATFYHLSNLADTSPNQGGRQYYIYLQAFSKSNQSNIAQRAFIVNQPSNVVNALSKPSAELIAVYPNPATSELTVTGTKGRPYVVDVLGRAYACTWQSGKLNIASLHSGVFYVTDGISHARFIKR